MKRILYFAAVCCMMLGAFTSCEMKEKEIGTLSDMFGRWRNDSNPQQYTVFYSDVAETGWYWGKEWDEAQGILEEDLTYHGNGWFKWSKTHDELTEIYVSEHGNILVPNHYRIDKLNDTTFVYTSFRITQTEYNQEKKVPFRVYHFHRS